MRQFIVTFPRREFRRSVVDRCCSPLCHNRKKSSGFEGTCSGFTNRWTSHYFCMGYGAEASKGELKIYIFYKNICKKLTKIFIHYIKLNYIKKYKIMYSKKPFLSR